MEATPAVLSAITLDHLTPLARQASQRDGLQICEWQVSPLAGGLGNPVSAGLYRFAGLGQDGDEQVAWSVILKIIQSPANVGWLDMGEGEDQSHWNYWRREFLVYQSGLLALLPEGLAVPRCYAATEQPGNQAWLWLEDIRDDYQGNWPLARYALAARHLGRFNGLYCGRDLSTFTWLSRQRTRQWAYTMTHWQTIPWDHPRVRARYPQPAAHSLQRLLAEHERFLAKLDQLPQTLCHGDTYPTNLMSRLLAGSGGQEQTIALDWALLGVQPLGDDLGQLVFGAQSNLPAIQRAEITETLFESYLDGLRESGCHADPRAVRFGFAASAALRMGLFLIFLLSEEIKQAAPNDDQDADAENAAPGYFELELADEAYACLEAMV